MKNATTCATRLTALLKDLPAAEPPDFPDHEDPVGVLVFSHLLVDASTDKALAAYAKLTDRIVDFNDLRVSMPHETVGAIGSRYPRTTERTQRLRSVLRNIYLREHEMTLEPLRAAGKREIKKYLESLEGMLPFVSARVMLLCFGTHAMPVDEQMRAGLISAGAADEDATVSEVSTWLSRQVKASRGLETYLALQAWVDSGAAKNLASGKRKPVTGKSTRDGGGKKKTTASGAANKNTTRSRRSGGGKPAKSTAGR